MDASALVLLEQKGVCCNNGYLLLFVRSFTASFNRLVEVVETDAGTYSLGIMMTTFFYLSAWSEML